ncbi:MAG: META domain-containing protein [Patescibacteria group bacterium]
MQTTNTNKIAIAVILIVLIGLVVYVGTKSDGVTNTDGTATTTVSTSTTNGTNNSKGGVTAKPGQIITVTPKQNPLAGTSWIWTDTIFMNKATNMIPAKSKFVITFGTDGAVTSSTDCNSVAGRYAVNNDRMNIVSLTSTLMACQGATLEAEYVKQLSQVTNYTFESLNELDLVVANGTSTMSFTRRQ